MEITKGKVYLAGAGPGDAGLLTLRVLELLRGADCVIFDALVSGEIMALAPPSSERVYVGKRGRQHAVEQPEINRILAEKARENKSVLRLKGGDPYLFGRGAEEALYLAENGIPVEIIPGITAGIAVPAYAGIPVTHREHASAVAFVTGHEDPNKPESALDWASLAKIGTLCFYMGVRNLPRIASELGKHLPANTPVAVIQWGSTPRQRTAAGTLETIVTEVQRMGIQAPALTVVGEVVRYREQLNFFERRPLFGRRVLVTRARAQASVLAEALSERGAQVFEFPTIRIEFAKTPELSSAARALAAGQFDWLILTSANGADAIFEELFRQQRDARAIRARVAAVGSATAARLKAHGIVPDLVPPEYVAESIATALAAAGETAGKRFLLARADIARSELPRALAELGGQVTDLAAYRTILETAGQEAALEALDAGAIDSVTFTSASTARNFAGILGPERLQKALSSKTIRFFSIGPQTSQSMREAGIPVHGEAGPHDISGLIDLVTGAK